MMINSNELRIGNLFRTTGGVKIVTGIMVNGESTNIFWGKADDSKYIDSRMASPIPLTAEWLERMEFKFLDSIINGRYFVAWANSNSEIAWYPVGEYVSVNTSTGGDGEPPNYAESPLPHVKYVHQIQNLYTDWTGEELTIN